MFKVLYVFFEATLVSRKSIVFKILDDECLTLCSKMVKKAHLACSESFDVQLKNGRPSELLTMRFDASPVL